MKLRSTTPASITSATKLVLIALSILVVAVMPIQMAQKVSAECSSIASCDSQISAKNQDIEKYNSEIARLSGEAQTLQTTVSRLSNEKSVIQSQLDISQATYDKLLKQIVETEQKIKDNQDALGTIIANMYVDDKITPIEMIASSKNVGDYLDKQEYRSSVRNELTSTIDKIKNLKKDLESQKIAVERVLADQKSQRDALAGKEAEQQKLLSETNSNANAYQQMTGELANQVAQLRADRIGLNTPKGSNGTTRIGPFAIYFRNWSGNTRCGGGYSYCNFNLDAYVSDPWGLHLAGECVHYTAWALANRGYYIPYGAFSIGNGYGGGSANRWVDVATGEGFASLVGQPKKDDLAYMPTSGVGHVGIVEQNYGDGWVRISQYNYAVYNDTPMYSTIDLKMTSDTQFLRFNR